MFYKLNLYPRKFISYVKTKLGLRVRTEGMSNSDWVLIDCGDVVVHVFREEVREFYQLERMWEHNQRTIFDSENV